MQCMFSDDHTSKQCKLYTYEGISAATNAASTYRCKRCGDMVLRDSAVVVNGANNALFLYCSNICSELGHVKHLMRCGHSDATICVHYYVRGANNKLSLFVSIVCGGCITNTTANIYSGSSIACQCGRANPESYIIKSGYAVIVCNECKLKLSMQ